LRKDDGTGFFLMIVSTAPPEIAPLIVGQYRIIMTYHRKTKADSQIYSQAGICDPENVMIDIPWEAH